MELFIFIFSAIILAETTILLIKSGKNFSLNSNPKRKVYVDTSALMDGRILAVAQTGFIGDDLIIPRSVIRELQLLADGKDSEKRTRARAGLDVVNELERIVFFNTEILQDELDRTPVDERLIELAKKNHGLILTNDFNLGKVAATEKIDVLNINDLALTLRSDFLPGDKMKIKIVAEGSNPKQGVGYLPDGTMAVVDNAAKKVGSEIEIELIRFLQTSAGRMMFAKIAAKPSQKPRNRRSR
ncbi:hypothetical protein IJF86_00510 [Candidatus Saccharibacteria bacterium]|nr:hypothetical protein [Candidatus Saccharibacteria bacterium]